MKKYTEKRVEESVRTLLQTLTRCLNDSGIVMDEYELVHNDREMEESRHYDALVAGHFALKEAIEKINYPLNKK